MIKDRQSFYIGFLVCLVVMSFIINYRFINKEALTLNRIYLNGKYYKLVEDNMYEYKKRNSCLNW